MYVSILHFLYLMVSVESNANDRPKRYIKEIIQRDNSQLFLSEMEQRWAVIVRITILDTWFIPVTCYKKSCHGFLKILSVYSFR